ncbi:hypothetical protein COCSUDRAFT_11899 [Coccomyxa subellipsoidea C-169]|uniref:Uncharacterized protein n=1 Tax=Coccomyxa subellipsoidea (strain C-169) TaxID=574566 RepID=I0Z6P6_COCSC|nr:hypothetical protein COCSUDRAFT_11899 [Coccomyxa subellipsoidea C-169]EIE26315.1 hypothetical protein COCSUDRAFT_11899 [Coccomyxa subellipsoidea C-169]|eukprot:XP_005650859.1 hypothetical protein COCSUDRAFT_11899 [Coccomyxa subellipsoidea C-169]
MPTFVPSSIGGNLCPFGHDVRVTKHPGLSAHLPLRNFVGQKYPFQPLRRSESSSLQVSSPTASADVKTSKQSNDSLTSSILSDPDIEGDPIKFLRVSEAYWQACPPCDILLRGHRVSIIEKRRVEGRIQEWNVSRHELQDLVELGLVTEPELSQSIATEFNPVHIGFYDELKPQPDIVAHDVLNLGVNPRTLLGFMRARFLEQGGIIYEGAAFHTAEVYPEGVKIQQCGNVQGHWSPIVRQMRGSSRPDGMCLVVGSCATSFPAERNKSGDFMRTVTDAEDDMQLFWQAFPAQGGAARTTYMFTYADCAKQRPSLQALLDRYFELLPGYQGVPLSSLKFQRVLFGGFPCYSSSPLQPQFDRILQVGDASSSQSPLSFGGFGSMLRHLRRLTEGLDAALQQDRLSRKALILIQPYQPCLAAAWLFQRSMALQMGQSRAPRGRRGQLSGFLPPSHINRLLRANFRVMQVGTFVWPRMA